jgi:hypothetical protein
MRDERRLFMEKIRGDIVPHSENKKWRETVAGWLSGMARNSRRIYLASWVMFFEFADCEPDEVTPELVDSWIDSLKAAGKSGHLIQARRGAVSSYYSYLLRAGIVNTNPATDGRKWLVRPQIKQPIPAGPVTFLDMLRLTGEAAA